MALLRSLHRDSACADVYAFLILFAPVGVVVLGAGKTLLLLLLLKLISGMVHPVENQKLLNILIFQ